MQESNISSEEILSFLVENGMINTGDVQRALTEKHIKEVLKQHPYEIWQGEDGRFRTYVKDETKPTGRRMIAKTHEQELKELLVRFYEEREKEKQKREQEEKEREETEKRELTLEKLYPRWLKYKGLHTEAETTIRRIGNDWKKYYIGTEIIKTPIINLTKLMLDEWVHKLIKDFSMTKQQYYNSSIIMRQCLIYAVDLGIIESNPFPLVRIDGKKMFRKVKKKPDYTQVFLKNEIPAIYSLAWQDFLENNRLKYRLAPLAILFQFQTGVRLGELCVCSEEDIESANYIHIQRMYRYETNEIVEHAKTECGDRKVFLTTQAKKYIQLARDYKASLGITSQYLFSLDELPLSPRSVTSLYHKYCDKLDIIRKTSHKTRKTFISALIDGKVNLNTIRELVGHADERTTLKNYCFDRNTEEGRQKQIEKALAS